MPQVGDRQGKKLGSSVAGGFGKTLKSVIPPQLLAIGTVAGLASAGLGAARAFEDAESVGRKLNKVLSNMGKSDAAPAVEKLASALQRQTGVDDEVIKGGQTILATFSSVAESAGQVGGTFERATKLSLDLAAAGFGSVDSASRGLGKALQDPERGIAALNRAGVTFTPTQKEQIKNFVAAGDALSAQDLILKEVERQVGGTAVAGAKSSEKLKTAFGEVQESVGGLLADLFEGGKGKKSFIEQAATATFNLSQRVSAFQKSATWKDLKTDMRTFGGDVKTVANALSWVVSSVDSLLKKKTNSGLFAWLGKVHEIVSPLGQVAGFLRSIQETWDKLTKSRPRGNLTGARLNPVGPSSGLEDFEFFAAGGIVTRPTLAVIGEAGPEAVVPLSHGKSSAGLASVGLASERPITMPDGTLFGWVKQIANGEATLVVNQELAFAGGIGRMGR